MADAIKTGNFSVISVQTETFVSHQTTKFNKQIGIENCRGSHREKTISNCGT